MSFWNVDRSILLLAALAVVAANAAFTWGDLASFFGVDVLMPLGITLVGLAIGLASSRPWASLASGIAVALLPLVILFVFGAFDAILHPASGKDAIGMAFVALVPILSLTGGISGFVHARKGGHAPIGMFLRTRQSLAAVFVIALVAGNVATVALASSEIRGLTERPAAIVEGAQTVRVVLTGYTFAPKEIPLPVGGLVVLQVENGDASAHTITYHHAGAVRETIIPAHSTVMIAMKIDAAGSIHVWCAPHSGGPDDRGEESMWGTLVVA